MLHANEDWFQGLPASSTFFFWRFILRMQTLETHAKAPQKHVKDLSENKEYAQFRWSF